MGYILLSTSVCLVSIIKSLIPPIEHTQPTNNEV